MVATLHGPERMNSMLGSAENPKCGQTDFNES